MPPFPIERKLKCLLDFDAKTQTKAELARARNQLVELAADFMAEVKKLPEGELFGILNSKFDWFRDLLNPGSPLFNAASALKKRLAEMQPSSRVSHEVLILGALGLLGTALGSASLFGHISLKTLSFIAAGTGGGILGMLGAMLQPAPRSARHGPRQPAAQELSEAEGEVVKALRLVVERAHADNLEGNSFLLNCCETPRSPEVQKRLVDEGKEIEHVAAQVKEAAQDLCRVVGIPRSESYAVFRWAGDEHEPAANQCLCVQTLHEAYLNSTDTAYVSRIVLLRQAGSSGKRVRDIFKSRPKLWEMIQPKKGATGFYRLTLVPPEKRPKGRAKGG